MRNRKKQNCNLSSSCIYHIALLISKEDVFMSLKYDKYIEFFEKGIKQLQLHKDILNIVTRFYNNFIEKHESRKKHWDDMKNE